LAAGAALGGLAALVAVGASILGDTSDYLYGAPLGFRLVLALPVLVLGVAAVAAALTIRGWRTSGAGVLARAHQVVLPLRRARRAGLVPLAVEPARLAVLARRSYGWDGAGGAPSSSNASEST
jgi:hypothetical protein